MSEVTVTNRFLHDRDGHAYSFKVEDGVLCVNGCSGEGWLRMARSSIEGVMAGRSGCSLDAAISYIDKGIAALVNTPVPVNGDPT